MDSANNTEVSSPAHQFDEIAFLYDELMAGIPYSAWLNYVQRLLKEFGVKPRTVLDLCCGTGSASVLLAEKGYEVAGVDISMSMIKCAREKAERKGLSVDFRAQNAARLRLGKRFDLVLCLFDSLNYILESSALQESFHRVFEHLKPGGLFIFDMNTEFALAGRMFDQNNLGTRASVIYDWRSTYDHDSRLCTIYMNFLCRRGADQKRIEITHYQRAYYECEVVEMLETSGLEALSVYDAYTLRRAGPGSDRVFYVAGKKSAQNR